MKTLFKVALGLMVLSLFGCASVTSAVKSYNVEESFGAASEAYRATILEE
jgi:uncharacterized protein YceK